MKRLLAVWLILLFCVGCQTAPTEATQEETEFLMDTVCTIRAGGATAAGAIRDAFHRVAEIQNAVNLYDPNSTVSRFNRAPAGEAIPLDADTAAILSTALEVCRATEGAFDITIAPVSALWPFHGEENPAPPEAEVITQALTRVDYRYLSYDPDAHTLTKRVEGVAIDLGGAAKGYASDCAAEVLQSAGVSYALLDFGGNIRVLGVNPNRRDGSFQVGIQTPFAASGVYSQTLRVTEGAVVTSGTYQRNFTYDGVLYHHILDPKTGYPAASGLSGVTITAPSALLADCLSTACLVLGEAEGRALAERFAAGIYLE